ncbi:MAG TPA: hypothetical protein VFM77_02945 [Terriglobales bacterium]|nr:hypothetical protein [Terriglobales bacterium]
MLDSEEKGADKSRRTFIKEISAFQFMAATLGRDLGIPFTTAPVVSSSAQSADNSAKVSSNKKFVAIQIGARSFVDGLHKFNWWF